MDANGLWAGDVGNFYGRVVMRAIACAGKKKRTVLSLTESDDSIRLLQIGESWSQWRGASGDGHGSGLPSKWTRPKRLWRHECPAQGIGGVAATADFVIVSSRDTSDKSDLFEVLDVESGLTLFQLSYPSSSELE